jgi:hypothetical protein
MGSGPAGAGLIVLPSEVFSDTAPALLRKATGTTEDRLMAATRKSRRTRKTRVTRKHEVKADLANFELAKARSSLTLQIYANKEKIGTLEVGRGSLYWQGGKRQRSERLDWSRFADMMDELAYGPQR